MSSKGECIKHVKHALVVGSSGITGHNLTKYLLLNHDWKVTGIAQKEYEHCPKGLNVLYCNLLDCESAKGCLTAEKLKDVTHVFFGVWKHEETAEKEVEVNSLLFQNLLNCVKECPKLRFVYLQTGTKYYGMHLGPIEEGYITPYKENQPRITSPMFYYAQEDLLKKFCKEKKGLKYSIGRPPCIIGFTLDNPMNFGTSLAIYAVIMKELGEPLIFPGSEKAFHCLREFVDVGLLCRFMLYLQSHEFCNKQAFNITNGDCMRASQFWPLVANYFGMEWKLGDKGFTIQDYMKNKGDVWRKIVQKYELHDIELSKIHTFEFLDQMLMREWDEFSNVNKAEKYGFRSHNDTDKVLLNYFDSLKNMMVIPSYEPTA